MQPQGVSSGGCYGSQYDQAAQQQMYIRQAQLQAVRAAQQAQWGSGFPGQQQMMNGVDGGKGSGGWDGKGKGRGQGKGKAKDKGKGKNFKGSFGSSSFRGDRGGDVVGDSNQDPKRQIELAQRRAKARGRSAIAEAQKTAQMRFESDMLERVQGVYEDEADSNTNYIVEGSVCSVSTGPNSRIFRNRLGLYGGSLCWDAKRFWHLLKVESLPGDAAEKPERVEWTPGEGSPMKQAIVWKRIEAPPAHMLEGGDGEVGDGEVNNQDTTADIGEANTPNELGASGEPNTSED